jgi:hypothetical protein
MSRKKCSEGGPVFVSPAWEPKQFRIGIKVILNETPGATSIVVLYYDAFAGEVAGILRRFAIGEEREWRIRRTRAKWIEHGLQAEVLDRILDSVFDVRLPQ